MTTKSVATARPAPRPVQSRANSPMLSHIHKVMGKEIFVKESEIKPQRVVALAILGVICTVLPFYLGYPLISIAFTAILLLYKLWLCKSRDYRTPLVLVWTIIGLLLGAGFIYLLGGTSLLNALDTIQSHGSLIATIFLLFVSAPVSFYLWSCRNEDKLKQIAQTEEQNKHNDEQSRLNSLSNAMRLFLEASELHAKAVGLMTLAKIKNKSVAFDAEIDMATSGAKLEGIVLTKANLTGINLSRAILTKANLSGAMLKVANLSGSILEGTNMAEANFAGANIEDAQIGVYNDDKNKKFSREEIESYLKQDWKTKASKQEFDDYMHIVLQEDKKTYSLIKKGGKPSDMSDANPSISGAGVAKSPPVQPEPKTGSSEKKDEKIDSNKGIPADVTLYRINDIINAPLNSAKAYCERGLAKMKREDFDGAIADFDEAIKLDRHYALAYRYRGTARLQKRRKEERKKKK